MVTFLFVMSIRVIALLVTYLDLPNLSCLVLGRASPCCVEALWEEGGPMSHQSDGGLFHLPLQV